MLSAMLPVVASAANAPTDFDGWMAALENGEYINVAAGKTIVAPGDHGNGTYGAQKAYRMVDNNINQSLGAQVADWVNISGNNFITIDLGRETTVDGVAISR